MKYQAADHIFLYGGTERFRLKNDGNMLVGGHTSALSTYNSSQPRLSIYKSSGSGGYLELGGNIPNNGHSSGTILFINNDNSEATSNNANGKILAMQRVENVTSDTNAGDDMGGDLVFMTKPEAGTLDERLRIDSVGKITTNTTGTLIADYNSSNSGGAYVQYDIGANGANIGYLGAGSHLVSGAATADLAIRSTSNFVISTGGAV